MSPVHLERLALRTDRELQRQLNADSGVLRALAKLEEYINGGGMLGRRRLLTQAVRLSPAMAPQLVQAVRHCCAVLGYAKPVELYVRQDSLFNACVMPSPVGPACVVLSSRLVECFSLPELTFVIGHEIGHLALNHLSIPMPQTALVQDFGGTIVSRPIALKLFLWCRAAEMSADRAGLVCCRDVNAGCSAFFKLASGLANHPLVQPNVDELKQQLDLLISAPAACPQELRHQDNVELLQTHPFSPMRINTMLSFAHSMLYSELIEERVPQTALSDSRLEEIVAKELEVMEPSYLEEETPHSAMLRELLFSASVSVAGAGGNLAEEELAALKALLGTSATQRNCEPQSERKRLETQILELDATIPYLDRIRLLQHVTIVAAADGTLDADEEAELRKFATVLGVDSLLVEQTLLALSAGMD